MNIMKGGAAPAAGRSVSYPPQATFSQSALSLLHSSYLAAAPRNITIQRRHQEAIEMGHKIHVVHQRSSSAAQRYQSMAGCRRHFKAHLILFEPKVEI